MQNKIKWPIVNLQSKYFVLKELGSGSYGTVSLAVAKADENVASKATKFAVKLIQQDVDAEYADREVRMLLAIKEEPCNENVICFVENFITDATREYVIVTRYVSGTLMYKTPIPSAAAYKSIIKSCLEALHFIHSRNVVHRDIKNDNIMIINANSLAPMVVFLDFGIGCNGVDDCIRQPHSVDEHKSPEQIVEVFEKKRLSFAQYKASDVWFLALALYILGTNKKLFTDKKERLFLEAKRKEREIVQTDAERQQLEKTILQAKKDLYNSLRKQHNETLGGKSMLESKMYKNILPTINSARVCKLVLLEMLQLDWRRRLLPQTGLMMIEKYEIDSLKKGFVGDEQEFGFITNPPDLIQEDL